MPKRPLKSALPFTLQPKRVSCIIYCQLRPNFVTGRRFCVDNDDGWLPKFLSSAGGACAPKIKRGLRLLCSPHQQMHVSHQEFWGRGQNMPFAPYLHPCSARLCHAGCRNVWMNEAPLATTISSESISTRLSSKEITSGGFGRIVSSAWKRRAPFTERSYLRCSLNSVPHLNLAAQQNVFQEW